MNIWNGVGFVVPSDSLMTRIKEQMRFDCQTLGWRNAAQWHATDKLTTPEMFLATCRDLLPKNGEWVPGRATGRLTTIRFGAIASGETVTVTV